LVVYIIVLVMHGHTNIKSACLFRALLSQNVCRVCEVLQYMVPDISSFVGVSRELLLI
jgi:hypothetical protein